MEWLWGVLLALIAVSGFFSGVETGVTSMNRYRLQHLMRKQHKAAIRLHALLKRPERVLGVILIGNTFANIMAATVASALATHYLGPEGVWLSSLVLTVVILIFSEVTPKTLAVHYPEKLAFFASYPLKVLLQIFYPLVWLISGAATLVMRLARIDIKKPHADALSQEELKGLVKVIKIYQRRTKI